MSGISNQNQALSYNNQDTTHQISGSNTQLKKKNDHRDYEEDYVWNKKNVLPSLRNQDWKTVTVENEKKSTFNKYPNEEHHETK